MDKKLTKDQQFFNDKTLEFAKDIYDKCEEQLTPIYSLQKKNRDDLLTEISKILLSYNIADNILKLSAVEKKKLYLDISNSITDKIKTELKVETNTTKNILLDATKLKYSTNNYIFSLGSDSKLTQAPEKTLDKIINEKIDGEIWSDRIWSKKNQLANDLKTQIKKFLKGEINVNDIEKVIKTKYNSSASDTKRLVNTEICRVQEQSNDVWQHDHNIEYVMYCATLDSHTCSECAELDGKVYKLDEKPVEIPRHPNDRCTYISLPNADFKPSKRMDNETKQNIDWTTYTEWCDKQKS